MIETCKCRQKILGTQWLPGLYLVTNKTEIPLVKAARQDYKDEPLRKFFSILISSFVLGSTLVGQQWAGIGLLFAGLLWNMQIKSSKGGSKRAKKAK